MLQALRAGFLLADLHQELLLERARRELFDPGIDAQLGGVRDHHHRGQGERREHRGVGGQHRGDIGRIDVLPSNRLVFERLRLAIPGDDAMEMQPDGGVGVRVDAGDPGRRLEHFDSELLAQLADQRGPRILGLLDLAARKLPVSRIRLALGTLCEQELPVGPLDDGGRNLRDFQGRRIFFFRPT